MSTTRQTRRAPFVAASAAVGLAGTLAAHALGGNSTQVTVRPDNTSTTAPSSPGTSAGGGTSPPTTASPQSSSSAVGALEQYGYGELSVRVSLRHGRIVGLDIVNLQTAESYSQQLAAQVIPVLKGEILAAQSARISVVSGATYTSEAYAASVQAALSQLHA